MRSIIRRRLARGRRSFLFRNIWGLRIIGIDSGRYSPDADTGMDTNEIYYGRKN